VSPWIVFAIYVVGAIVISFALGRRRCRTSDNEAFMVIWWPIVAVTAIVVGPFLFANWLGNKSRTWR